MSDTLKEIADNLGVTTINGSYLSGIADYYGVDLATSTDLMRDILVEVGGDPATSTDYLQDIVLELGGTVTINGNWMEAWEAITAVAPAPVNTVLPVASGGTYIGDLLTTTDGTWTGSPTFTYQWYNVSLSQNIAGATSNSHTLVDADAGADIICIVTGTNAAGSTIANSNSITTLPLAAPTNIDLPFIDDGTTYYEGSTLGFTGNVWDGNPVPVLTYRWLRNGGNISGATDDTYDAISADVNNDISVKCTATNSQGTDFVISNEVLIDP